jgi:hypothetical protein
MDGLITWRGFLREKEEYPSGTVEFCINEKNMGSIGFTL